MTKLRLSACALLFGLFAGPAMAARHHGRPGRSDDRPIRLVRHADEERRRTGGDRYQCRGRRARQEAQARNRRRRLRSQAGAFGREKSSPEWVSPSVFGHYCSSSSIPASDAYLDGGVLQITPASTNPLFTERGMWNTFRTCGRDDQQGTIAGDYIAKTYQGQEHRYPARQVDLRQRAGRRDEEGAQQGRRERKDVRGL